MAVRQLDGVVDAPALCRRELSSGGVVVAVPSTVSWNGVTETWRWTTPDCFALGVRQLDGVPGAPDLCRLQRGRVRSWGPERSSGAVVAVPSAVGWSGVTVTWRWTTLHCFAVVVRKLDGAPTLCRRHPRSWRQERSSDGVVAMPSTVGWSGVTTTWCWSAEPSRQRRRLRSAAPCHAAGRAQRHGQCHEYEEQLSGCGEPW